MNVEPALLAQLRQVIPFRFLQEKSLVRFASRCRLREYAAGRSVIRQGDARDKTCYILLSGQVEVVDSRGAAPVRVGTIEPNHYFGEWEVIFDLPRVYGIRAIEPSRCLVFGGNVLMGLLEGEGAFAQALSSVLRQRQGIFRAFELFNAELSRGIGYGHISIQKLLPLYQALEPALHPHVNDPSTLDIPALDYAVRRLPRNVTSTFAFLIRDELPVVYANPDEYFTAIPTDARRRSIWEILPGKDLFLTRTGMADITDFITCLCIYSTEARKIRRHIYDVKGVRGIRDFVEAVQGTEAATQQLLTGLGFKPEDAQGIIRVWPKDTVKRLWEMVNHREMFSVDVRTQQSSYNLKDFSRWSSQIGQATRELTGHDPGDLPRGIEVHIISSNTHSVTNCLNPWYAANAERIWKWARDTGHPVAAENWTERADCLYSIARDFFKAHPGTEAEMMAWEREHGILRLGATATTGIEVEVINLEKIRGAAIDPRLTPWQGKPDTLIVNIDYAFGEQAEYIIHQLILLYGKHIKSVNFLGKAGSLVGNRGDILIPTAFIEQSNDQYMSVTPPPKADLAAIKALVGERGVHVGPMLTVMGTLMQNRLMLHFYRHLWAVKGIEMEGVFYHRQVVESIQTGVLNPNLVSRFYYYVSDLPLDVGSNLSERLKASEGVPPLYAITRQILGGIFS
jgi:hypothetical protein